MATTSDSTQIRRRKVGTYLMLLFTVGWIVVMLSIQFYQAHVMGFGSGFGDGGHMPAEIAAKYGNDVRAAVAATSHNAPEISLTEDLGRLLFSLGVLTGIVYFWYLVMSRIGTF